MHTWLPDAHGKASTPVSALMSSILLPLALYVIIKLKIIVDYMI
jgi:hydrogenase-4 component F